MQVAKVPSAASPDHFAIQTLREACFEVHALPLPGKIGNNAPRATNPGQNFIIDDVHVFDAIDSDHSQSAGCDGGRYPFVVGRSKRIIEPHRHKTGVRQSDSTQRFECDPARRRHLGTEPRYTVLPIGDKLPPYATVLLERGLG
jgi:hypothetical protein